MHFRTAVVWAAFAALFATGPAPWSHASARVTSARRADPQRGPVAAIRSRAEHGLDAGQPADAAALLDGMTLGDPSKLSLETKRQFRLSSLTHIVAASGQNIALMLALTLPLLGAAGLGLRARLLVGLCLIAGYVPLAGGEAPIRRAAVMAVVLISAKLRGRSADGWHALGVAGVVTLAADRGSAASLGWQLSFVAVAAMLSLGSRLERLLARLRLPGPLAEALSMTVAATAATSPVIAWRVGRLSLTAIPANLIAAPAVAPAMWAGMISAGVAQVSDGAAVPFAWLASIPAGEILETARTFSSPSWAGLSWKPSGAFAAASVVLLVGAGLVRRPSRSSS